MFPPKLLVWAWFRVIRLAFRNHLFKKYVLHTSYFPDTVQATEHTGRNNEDRLQLPSWGVSSKAVTPPAKHGGCFSALFTGY